MKPGTLVAFAHKSGPKAGLVIEPQGKSSWVLKDERGQAYTIAAKEALFELEGGPATVERLPGFWAQVVERRAALDLTALWELSEGQKTTTLDELAGLNFSQVDPAARWALWEALHEDRIFFKEKTQGIYEVRSTEQVSQLRHALEAETQREAAWRACLTRFEARLAAPHPGPFDPEDEGRREALEQLALWGEEAQNKNQALKLLEALGRPGTELGARKLLVDLGWWNRHENLFIRRKDWPGAFSPEVEAAAARLAEALPPDADAATRRDLRGLFTLTIDSDSTVEIDDGLALEGRADGLWLWVFIADPGRALDPPAETEPEGKDPAASWRADQALVEAEARRRATTLYLPTGLTPMIPLSLSAGPLSLNPGQDSPAFALALKLGEDGALLSWEATPALIRSDRRLSYEEADALLAAAARPPEAGSSAGAGSHANGAEPSDPAAALLARLWPRVQTRKSWREARGATTFRLPEIDPKVAPDGTVTLEPVADTPSRQLVSECMILASEAAARLGIELGAAHLGSPLPLPYRGQALAEHAPDVSALPNDPVPVADYARRRSLGRSLTDLVPAPHASLALDAYCQVTSPLRRYADLWAQRQLKAVLRGGAPAYDPEAAATLIAEIGPKTGQAAGIERDTDKYWLLEYLSRRQGQTFTAWVLAAQNEGEKIYQLMFPDLGLEWLWRAPRALALGEILNLKIKAADPWLERLVLAEA